MLQNFGAKSSFFFPLLLSTQNTTPSTACAGLTGGKREVQSKITAKCPFSAAVVPGRHHQSWAWNELDFVIRKSTLSLNWSEWRRLRLLQPDSDTSGPLIKQEVITYDTRRPSNG